MFNTGNLEALTVVSMETMEEMMTTGPGIYGRPRYVSMDSEGRYFVYPLSYRMQITKKVEYV